MNEFLNDPAIMGEFVAESHEHLESLEPKLLQLEKNPEDPELLNGVFRTFHTIKGSSSFLGLTQVTELSHKLENVLDKLRKRKIKVTAEIIDLLFKGMDIVKSLIEDVASGEEEKIKKVTGDSLKNVEEFIVKIEHMVEGQKKEESKEKVQITQKKEMSQGKQIFLTAAHQHLSIIEETLEGLEKNPSNFSHIDALFRAVHSLKSSSDYMGFSQITNLLKEQEKILSEIRKEKSFISSELLNLLKENYQYLFKLIEAIKKGKERPLDGQRLVEMTKQASTEKKKEEVKEKAPSKELPKKEIVEKTIRVPEAKLDLLMNLASELVINRSAFLSLSQKLETQYNLPQISKELKETTQTMRRITDELQVTVTDLHMLPIKTLFGRFPRLVRDLSREKGKEIKLEMLGEETQLDKMMIEKMGDPLVHLIRNAIDHGIERPEEREAKGKPKCGTIRLSALQEGETVIIQIEDDGQGLDPEMLKQVAIKKRILDEEKSKLLDEHQCLELIFLPGFSTARRVTDISGRGVGMDVVKNTLRDLKGEIEIHTEPNRGTRFTIKLPLTMAITDALLIEAGGQVFALPLHSIRETVKISLDEINRVLRKEVTFLRGNIQGIVNLGELLHLSNHTRPADWIVVVIIEGRGKSIGLVVDALHQQEEIVIKPLEGVIADTPGLAGATILGDGKVIPILDPGELIQMAES